MHIVKLRALLRVIVGVPAIFLGSKQVVILVQVLSRHRVVSFHCAYVCKVCQDDGPVEVLPFVETIGLLEQMLSVVKLALGEAALALLDQGVCEEFLIGHLVEEQDCLKKFLHLMLKRHPTKLLGDVASVHEEECRVLCDLQVTELEAYLDTPLSGLRSAICSDESEPKFSFRLVEALADHAFNSLTGLVPAVGVSH